MLTKNIVYYTIFFSVTREKNLISKSPTEKQKWTFLKMSIFKFLFDFCTFFFANLKKMDCEHNALFLIF